MNRKTKLIVSIILDFIGYLSYALPAIGEGFDLVWAPVSAVILYVMYKGKKGMIGGLIEGVEEILPFTDFVPTFTLMWIYTYYFEKKNKRIN